jgi:D-glycero-D-manno-heptose 1,7-bisphosphate phosphatase
LRSAVYVQRLQTSGGYPNRRFLFLDRDGVINHDREGYTTTVADFKLISGAVQAISAATLRGWIINICSNQPGIAEGLMTHNDLNTIHLYLRACVEERGGDLAEIYYCPHTQQSHCPMRKPRPGLLNAVSREFEMTATEIQSAWMVGDNVRDVTAGQSFGCNVAFVQTDGVYQSPDSSRLPHSTLRFRDLPQFVAYLISTNYGDNPVL